jgi:hypothetical protein
LPLATDKLSYCSKKWKYVSESAAAFFAQVNTLKIGKLIKTGDWLKTTQQSFSFHTI